MGLSSAEVAFASKFRSILVGLIKSAVQKLSETLKCLQNRSESLAAKKNCSRMSVGLQDFSDSREFKYEVEKYMSFLMSFLPSSTRDSVTFDCVLRTSYDHES